MAVKIVSAKAKTAEALADSIVQPEVVDEYATLSAKLKKATDKMAPLAKQVSDLQTVIIGAADSVLAPEVKVTLPGIDYELQLGAQGKKMELVDAEAAFEMLEFDLFLKLAKISVANLKAYLNPDQLAKVTESKFKIKRRVKIVKL